MDILDLVTKAKAAKKYSRSDLVKVGCVIQDKEGNIYTGYNGCGYLGDKLENDELKSNPGVIHAEADAIAHVVRKGTATLNGAVMVVTLAPCINCAALISNTGIKQLYYLDPWWDVAALEMLKMHGVKVTKVKIRKV